MVENLFWTAVKFGVDIKTTFIVIQNGTQVCH